MSEAMNIVSGLLSRENAVILTPGDRHLEIFRKLVSESGVSGAKISDAHLAALAIEHGATLASADRDFRLFDGLKLINPLLDS
jgi:predicted nucleic acid-binding protein